MPAKKTTTKKSAKSTKEVSASSSVHMSHEKAMLIGLAYLIGFVTAYIAFAVNASHIAPVMSDTKNHTPTIVNNRAAASEAIKAIANDEGLFVMNGEVERIISAKVDDASTGPGYHRQISAVTVSGSGEFVHYCALMNDTDDVCSNFVYSVDADTVYRVSNSDGPIDTSTQEASDAHWNEAGLLVIGERASVSAETPWVLEIF